MAPQEEQNLDLKIKEDAKKFVEDFNDEDQFDFSEESLVHVDRFIADQYQFGDPLNAEYNNEIVELVGSYVLEVARKIYGGNYMWNKDKSAPILMSGQPKYEIVFSTFEKIKKRMETERSENILYYFNIFAQKVKNAKPGDKDSV
jgi:hypothetical protein